MTDKAVFCATLETYHIGQVHVFYRTSADPAFTGGVLRTPILPLDK